jgi:hypothetical protein
MKKITIEGKFTGSVNNYVVLDVFRSNSSPNPYDFRKAFNASFKETLKDLHENTSYNIDFSGFTTGKFDLKISGEIEAPNPITGTYENDSFNPGYLINTNNTSN